MGKHVLDYMVRSRRLSPEFKEVYRNRYRDPVYLVDYILSNPNSRTRVGVVEFSLAEIFSAVRDEARSILLLLNGVPLSRWGSRRHTSHVRIPMSMGEKIYRLTMEAFDKLFYEGGIEILATASPTDYPDFFPVYSSLLFYNPELTTQDAILLTTAIFEKSNYFVTEDTVIRRLSRRLEENYGLTVLNSRNALDRYRRHAG